MDIQTLEHEQGAENPPQPSSAESQTLESPPAEQTVPPAAPPPQAATPEPQAAPPSVAPASGKKSQLGTAIVIGLVVVVMLAGVFQATVLGPASEARAGAERAIAAAETAFDDAQLAVEPGSEELTQSQESEAALAEAKRLRDSGMGLIAARYREATQKAESAEEIAAGISARVEDLARQARAATSYDAPGLYFELYRRFPRTSQGGTAIEDAATVLTGNLSYDNYDALAQIKKFCNDSPAEVPASVYSAADDRLKSVTRTEISYQKSIVSNNKSWSSKMLAGKRISFSARGTTAANTRQVSRYLKLLSAVKATEYKAVLTLLRDSSKLGQKCESIRSHPVRRTRTTRFFSSSQIKRVRTYSGQMSTKLSKAAKLLKRI